MVALSPRFIALGVVLFGSSFSSVLADQLEDNELVARELESFGASLSARQAMGVISAREPTSEDPSSLSHVISFREFNEEPSLEAREVDSLSHTINFREVVDFDTRDVPSSPGHTISFREVDPELETREVEEEEPLDRRSVEDNIYEVGDVAHLNSRGEEEELDTRSVEDNIYEVGDVAHLNSREEEEELDPRSIEDNIYEIGDEAHLNSRSVDEDEELVARDVEEDEELSARSFDEEEELFTRGVEDNIYEVGDVAHLNSRSFEDDIEGLSSRGFSEDDELDLD